MQIKIDGEIILFQAIESFRYETDYEGTNFFVLRAVSGKEHKEEVSDEVAYDKMLDDVLTKIDDWSVPSKSFTFV